MIEICFDGLCEPKNPGGVATWGFVVYRDRKKVHEDCGLACEPYAPHATNNVGEYMGLIKALEYLVEQKIEGPVVARGDSKLVIEQSAGRWKVKSPNIAPLNARVRELFFKFKDLAFEWIPREENREADALTNAAYARYAGKRLPAPTTDVMSVDLLIAAPRDTVAAALRKAGIKAEATALPGATRVQCDLPADDGALKPLLDLKRRLEGS